MKNIAQLIKKMGESYQRREGMSTGTQDCFRGMGAAQPIKQDFLKVNFKR